MLAPHPMTAFAPAAPRDAAVVVLVRKSGEVFWVRRALGLAFPGFHAFPGGSVDPQDSELPIAGLGADQARLVVAAVRELFEETGVLLARGGDLHLAERIRRELVDRKIRFAQGLAALNASLDPSLLTPAGRWLTPPSAPVRFDARFFLARLPQGQRAEVWRGELEQGEWIQPCQARSRWETGVALMHPPALHVMRTLADGGSRDELCSPPHVVDYVAERIDLQRGVHMMPLLTPTLPPARHTICYLIGESELLLVDPGSPDPIEQERLAHLLCGMLAEGRRLKAIVLTHHHPDHVLGARAVQQAFPAPIWAHRLTAGRWGAIDRALEDGEELALGGEFPMRWTVLHTPGHSSDHLCLFHPESRAALCGDMLSGVSTIIIDPPDGDMEAYLGSLDRLARLGVRSVYPAHGEPMPDGLQQVRKAIDHRRWREEKLIAALEQEPLGLEELTRRVYDELPPIALPFAARSALASLLWLERRGRIGRVGDRFRLTS